MSDQESRLCPQPHPATTHASGGLREAGGGSLLNVAPYFQFCCTQAIHRVGVASRPCKAIQLKSAYTSSFRQLKSAIRRSCMYGAHTCTVAHGLSVRKEKERIAKKRCTGGGKRKEKKRKDPWETMTNEARRTRARHCAYQAGRHPTKLSCAFSYGSLLGPFNVGTPPCPLGV